MSERIIESRLPSHQIGMMIGELTKNVENSFRLLDTLKAPLACLMAELDDTHQKLSAAEATVQCLTIENQRLNLALGNLAPAPWMPHPPTQQPNGRSKWQWIQPRQPTQHPIGLNQQDSAT